MNDKELESFIGSLLSNQSLSWKDRFNKIIEWKKLHTGLNPSLAELYSNINLKNKTLFYKTFVKSQLSKARRKQGIEHS